MQFLAKEIQASIIAINSSSFYLSKQASNIHILTTSSSYYYPFHELQPSLNNTLPKGKKIRIVLPTAI